MTPTRPSPGLVGDESSSQAMSILTAVGWRLPDAESTPGGPVGRPHVMRRRTAPAGWRRWLALPVVAVVLGACSSADPVESPPPGGTRPPSSDATVRAPNGTNMGAPPINAGTGAP